MLASFRSQRDLENFVVSEMECFRPQKAYDFSSPPAAVINYEMWGWKMRATELCCRFSKFSDWTHVPTQTTHDSFHPSAAVDDHRENRL